MSRILFHYTNKAGFNGISAQKAWRVIAYRPRSGHPVGAYFSDFPPSTPMLARKLLIPRQKTGYVFVFRSENGLKELDGGRGENIFYSPTTYYVEEFDQIFHGLTSQYGSGRHDRRR